MLSLVLLIGVLNAVGGRWQDVAGKGAKCGRLIFRCILPGVLMGAYAHSFYVWFAVTVGSALWYAPGWSHDEITGQFDRKKYPNWVRRIGLHFFSDNHRVKQNRKRGMLMKGIRGGYDVLTFALLSYVNLWAIVLVVPTLLMGVVYWMAGRFMPTQSVLIAEFVWGCARAMLLVLAVR